MTFLMSLAATLVLLTATSVEASSKAPTDWSKLTGASVLLDVAAQEPETSPRLCELHPDEARELRAKLDKKIDAVMKTWALSHKRAGTVADPSWPVNCQELCNCGRDASLLENVGLAHLGTQDRWIFRRVSTLALEQRPSDEKACASRQTWFCESALLKQLRRSK